MAPACAVLLVRPTPIVTVASRAETSRRYPWTAVELQARFGFDLVRRFRPALVGEGRRSQQNAADQRHHHECVRS